MNISHPRRILALSRPGAGLVDLIQALTGTTPLLNNHTIAGTTHTWPLQTPYYTAQIHIWLDETTAPSTWAQEFLAPEAREVLSVLGALVVCFRKPVDEMEFREIMTLLGSVEEVVNEGCGATWDGVCVAVGMPQSTTPKLEKGGEEWEEVCRGFGFEFVDFEGRGRNEFSEPVGIDRLKEALETNEWDGGGFEDGRGLGLGDESDEETGFGIEAAEVEQEIFGIKQAIYESEKKDDDGEYEGDQEEEVEKLQQMMLKMQAVKDLGSSLPEPERKRFAAKALNDMMKTM